MAANNHYQYDDDEEEDDFGIHAYNEIQAELSQWGNDSHTTPAVAAATSRRQNIHEYNDYIDDDGNDDEEDDDMIILEDEVEFGRSYNRRGPVGVQTPQPPPPSSQQRRRQQQHHANAMDDSFAHDDDERQQDIENEEYSNDYDANNIMDTNRDRDSEHVVDYDDDSTTSTRLYHDALYTYFQNKERLMLLTNSNSGEEKVGDSIMGDGLPEDPADTANDAALYDADMKFLNSLGSICLSRASSAVGGEGWADTPQKNEGNFWNLLTALRAHGLSSLFYSVNGEDIPEWILSNDLTTMVDSAPADVLDAFLGAVEGAPLTLRRLYAVLRWIEEYHGRKFEERLDQEYQGSDNPLLPPPRRRSMWPSTLAALKERGKIRSTGGVFHPDAPLQTALADQHRSTSPVGVVPFSLEPQDEVDDARLLRACFMLFQAGRIEEATKLVHDCGQPWRAISWTGGVPLSSCGVGNRNRALWKSQCRKIAKAMAALVNTTHDTSMADNIDATGLYPSIAYEAAIMSLLSDNVDTAFSNPVFQTWEDGLHAILRSEVGIIEDEVLNAHNDARVKAFEIGGGHFPYPGTEFQKLDMHGGFQGNGGNLGAALELLEASPVERMREEGGDPFRNGITSFLIGQNAVKDYIERCVILCLEMEDDDDASFLRFITHLVLYVSAVLPDFCSQFSLVTEGNDVIEESMLSLPEQLVLKYVAHLSSRRDLWSYVALYSSLLSEENMITTFSSFLTHVHSKREREMTLKQARDLFPAGIDCLILRNVVRFMIFSDETDWTREPGEVAAPTGVAPAHARMMRSIHWLCFYPEHSPDALAAANMLLRKFFLVSASNNSVDTVECNLMHTSKVFIQHIFPREALNLARESLPVIGCNSSSSLQNLLAEFFSMETYLKAHTMYLQFIGALSMTSPCHKSKTLVDGKQSKHEIEIAGKMERNTFRQKKAGLCKMIIESANRASNTLMEVLTVEGGWLVDAENPLGNEDFETEEAAKRSDELKKIRSSLVPKVVCMLHEVLNKTALWLEQVVHDTLAQFGDAGTDMILTLFGSFDSSNRTDDDSSIDLLSSSKAAPGYWHKKAFSLASVVANDENYLHEAYDRANMQSFLVLMAESHISLSRTISRNFIEC